MKELFGIIYLIINKINGKMYVGQTTKTLSFRWKQHCSSQDRTIYNAIKKYGKENFLIEEITKCNFLEEMNYREVFFIKLFNTLSPNGYNLTSGGGHPRASKEVGIKISKSKKGIYTLANKTDQEIQEINFKKSKTWSNRSDEEKAEISKKQSEAQLIAQNKPETRKKNSDSNKIAQNKPEQLAKLREASAGKNNPMYGKNAFINKTPEQMLVIKHKKQYATHDRCHFSKGILNLDCKFCIEQVMKEHS